MNNFIQSLVEATAQKEDKDTPKSTTNPIPKQLESLTTTIFQSLFAPISPQQTSLNSIKRVMLLDRMPSKHQKPTTPTDPDDTTTTSPQDDPDHQFVLQLRHFAIKATTPKHSLPKSLRRLEAAEKLSRNNASKGLPNLGRLDDVADYILDPTAAAGFTSASESEADTDAEVEVLAPENRKVLSKEERQHLRDAQRARIAAATANGEEPPTAAGAARTARAPRTEKKAIKLQELGPRMTLRLTKVEEGLCGGKIMWHEYISKSKTEEKELQKNWEEKRKVREERKRVQKENVEKKKKSRGADKKARKEGEEGEGGDDDEDMEDAWSSDDDDEWHGEHDGEGGDTYTSKAMIVDDDDEEEDEEE